MTNVWLSTLVPTEPRIEQIDLWDAWFGQGDHRQSVAPHGFVASSDRGAT
jgi:hypothetical protein